MTIHMSSELWEDHQYRGITIKVGGIYTVSEHTNINTNACWYRLTPGDNGGIGGNMDSSIRRYHGWRGTTNNVSVYACGLRKVEAITQYKNGNYRIKLSDDLKAEEE